MANQISNPGPRLGSHLSSWEVLLGQLHPGARTALRKAWRNPRLGPWAGSCGPGHQDALVTSVSMGTWQGLAREQLGIPRSSC